MQASKEWQWQRCEKRNRLLIDLGETLQLCTPYRLHQLTADSASNPNFCIDDATYYQNVLSYLHSFTLWSEPQCCQIALNATAAKFHLRPMLAKSWFFNKYKGLEPRTEAIISLQSSIQSGDFLIVECDDESALCMCLEPHYQLDEHLSLEQFQAIRVLNNRIYPLIMSDKNSKRA